MYRSARFFIVMASFASAMGFMSPALAADPIKVLIISGQNNHDWKKSTPLLAKILNSARGHRNDH